MHYMNDGAVARWLFRFFSFRGMRGVSLIISLFALISVSVPAQAATGNYWLIVRAGNGCEGYFFDFPNGPPSYENPNAALEEFSAVTGASGFTLSSESLPPDGALPYYISYQASNIESCFPAIEYVGPSGDYGQICNDGTFVLAGQACDDQPAEQQPPQLVGEPQCNCNGAQSTISDTSVHNNTSLASNGTLITAAPIDVGGGNVFHAIHDYNSPGSNPLSFSRYYNSRAVSTTYAVALGVNWRHSYDRYLNVVSSASVTAERASGQVLTFTNNGSGWTTDSDMDYSLTQNGTTWTLTDHNDSVEVYNQLPTGEALLQTITTRNGYVQTLAYNGSNQLTSVTDSFGRQLTFSYYTTTADAGHLNTVTTPDGLTIVYVFGSSGITPNVNDVLLKAYRTDDFSTPEQYFYTQLYDLTEVLYENGSSDNWTYDINGRGTSSFGGNTENQNIGNGAGLTQIGYNDSSGSRTLTNALGEVETYNFVTQAGISKVASISRTASSTAVAGAEVFTYDSNGYMASRIDWNGNVTHYVNDSHGDPTSITEAYGTPQARMTTVAYDATFLHLPDSIITPRKTTAFTYDAHGNMLSQTDTDTAGGTTNGQTRVWKYTYDSLGHVLSAKGPKHKGILENTTYTYYTNTNNINTVTDALGHVSTITSYDSSGHPLSMTDPNGVVTNLTYSQRGFLTSVSVQTAAGAALTQFNYDATGRQLKTIILPDNTSLLYTYDTASRVIQVGTGFGGETISYTYDGNGDIVQQQTVLRGTLAKTQSAVFDSLGRMLQQIGASGQVTNYSFDADGNTLSVKDPLSNTTSKGFDALNRLISQIDPLSNSTSYAYDSQNDLTSVTDARGNITTYVYDAFGEVLSESSPDRGATSYTYDKDGNLTKVVDARGANTQRAYDALNRVTAQTHPDGTIPAAYTYDTGAYGIGRLSGFTDASGSAAYSYDALGDVLSDTRMINGRSYMTGYTYNLASRVTGMTYPSGDTVTYTLDADGRISGIAWAGTGGNASLATNVTYEPYGPVTGYTLGNGLNTTLAYDQDYRLTGISTTGNAPVQGLTLAYDGANDITSITDALDNTRNQAFTYDADYRLLTATGKYGSDGFTYDAVGNRLMESEGGTGSSYSYPSTSNMLTSITSGKQTRKFIYDKDGNITLDNRAAAANAKFTYDRNNNLSEMDSVVSGTTTASTTYLYNALNQRVVKNVTGGAVTSYVYDETGHLIAEYNGPTLIQEYVYLNDIPLAQILANGTIYYIHTDQLGTPQKLTDPGQNLVYDRIQHPFGEDFSVTGTAANNIRFPGQYFDAESGINQNWNRNYDSTMGRYTQFDKIGLNGGINGYGYVMGNPVTGIDPSGQLTAVELAPTIALGTIVLGIEEYQLQGKLPKAANDNSIPPDPCALAYAHLTNLNSLLTIQFELMGQWNNIGVEQYNRAVIDYRKECPQPPYPDVPLIPQQFCSF